MYLSDYIILALLVGGWLTYVVINATVRRRVATRAAGASRRTEGVMEILQSQGYDILDISRKVPLVTTVDGRTHQAEIEADFIVRKLGKTCVAIIRRSKGERLTNRKTRRQLLEYYVAHGPSAVLLVDPDTRKIRTIEVKPAGRFSGPMKKSFHYLLVFASGVLVAYLLLRFN